MIQAQSIFNAFPAAGSETPGLRSNSQGCCPEVVETSSGGNNSVRSTDGAYRPDRNREAVTSPGEQRAHFAGARHVAECRSKPQLRERWNNGVEATTQVAQGTTPRMGILPVVTVGRVRHSFFKPSIVPVRGGWIVIGFSKPRLNRGGAVS